jgi:hypothetical protein
MIRNKPQGRTGNLLLQNIGNSILSKKFDLKVETYFNIANQDILGVHYHHNGRTISNLVRVYDIIDRDNMISSVVDGYNIDDCLAINEFMFNEQVNFGLDLNCSFQTSYFVKNFRKEILDHFSLIFLPKKNNLFVHVRLGDVISLNPGLEYYREAIKSIDYEKGYISSDSLNHPITQSLISEFNLIPLTENDPINVLNFAKDFEYLVLSKGTFSWWMAMLSKAEIIIFPKNDIQWYGDIFVFEDWKFIEIKK